jgi:hypothetical protein
MSRSQSFPVQNSKVSLEDLQRKREHNATL